MERSTIIAVAVVAVIAAIIIFLVIYILTFHYMHHSYSSGSWINKNGDILIVRNLGPLSNSQFKICENNGENYNVLESTCKILTNPFSLPHRFSMYMFDNTDDKVKSTLVAKIDMVTGQLKLSKDGTSYGTFHRNSFQ